MGYKNLYSSKAEPIPSNCHLDTEPDEYDFNFMFEVAPLRSDRVELRPFVPKLHAKALCDGARSNSELIQYLGMKNSWQTVDEVCEWQEETGRRNPALLRYAIYSAPLDNLDAPAEDYVFAGTASLLESNYDHMISEIGWLVVLSEFQKTHVTTHTVGLMMHRILDTPDQGGLGLRRCQWKANSLNQQSAKTSQRMGFTPEGVLRALVVLPPGGVGIHPGRPGVRNADRPQRDTYMASVIWQEWESGVRDKVDKLMARR